MHKFEFYNFDAAPLIDDSRRAYVKQANALFKDMFDLAHIINNSDGYSAALLKNLEEYFFLKCEWYLSICQDLDNFEDYYSDCISAYCDRLLEL